MEEPYIGTKVVLAEPMGEFEFHVLIRPILKEGQPPRDGYKVTYEDGYVSWSPKKTFERAYRKVTIQEAALIVSAGGQKEGE